MLKAILFDFDGVIVNSEDHTIYCFQRTFDECGKSIPVSEDIRKLMGLTVPIIFNTLIPGQPDEMYIQMQEKFKNISDATFTKIQLMPEVTDVIKRLGEYYKLAIVSNRRSESLHKLLLHHKLNNYFSVVYGREDVQNHKPHPEGIEKALVAIDVKPSEAIFIGDAEQDVHAAKNAGIPCVLINENDNIHQAKYHIKSIAELPGLINEFYEK